MLREIESERRATRQQMDLYIVGLRRGPVDDPPAQSPMEQSLSLSTKLFCFASWITSGIFLISYVIGTDSVTPMASAGAHYGMSGTWTLVPASFFAYLLFVAISKCTIVTGNTIVHNSRTHFGAKSSASGRR